MPKSFSELVASNDNWPFFLNRTEAANMCGLTVSMFDTWVRKSILSKAVSGTRRWSRREIERATEPTGKIEQSNASPLRNGNVRMLIRIKGVNKVRAKLANGEYGIYHYHRATGTRLSGAPGSTEFGLSFSQAEEKLRNRDTENLANLVRNFEATRQWRRLADSTKKEYVRVLKFWDAEYGSCPYAAIEDKAF